MSDDINRILIGSVVRKTIADAQNSPGRSVRNLVDAGVNFAKGSFQKRFLGDVQTILQNEDSAYYDLAKDILSNVDRHILFTLGMNLGYNGCTKGVKTIRETEKKKGFHVPWALALRIYSEEPGIRTEDYLQIFREGTALGVYTYLVFLKGKMSENTEKMLLEVLRKQAECAFVLYTDRGRMSPVFIRAAGGCGNVMIAVPDDEYMAENCRNLRKARMLYGIYSRYGEQERENILNGMWLSGIRALQPQFAFLVGKNEILSQTAQEIYQYVRKVRQNQQHPLICIDVRQDAKVIDQAMSCDGNIFREPLVLELAEDGGEGKYVRESDGQKPDNRYNSLEEVFRMTEMKN